MIKLIEVTNDNIWDVCHLKVTKEQENFVAPNVVSLAEYCFLSYEKENKVAKKLYESFGFRENGEICDGELVSVLKL